MRVEQNATYRALLDAFFAPESMVRGALEKAGFDDITFWKDRNGRKWVQAKWPGISQDYPDDKIDSRLKDITKQ